VVKCGFFPSVFICVHLWLNPGGGGAKKFAHSPEVSSNFNE
jgi:hypothetical protein